MIVTKPRQPTLVRGRLAYRSSATRGAVRLNTQNPTAKIASTTDIGHNDRLHGAQQLPCAGRVVGDVCMAKLLQEHRQRIEHVEVEQELG